MNHASDERCYDREQRGNDQLDQNDDSAMDTELILTGGNTEPIAGTSNQIMLTNQTLTTKAGKPRQRTQWTDKLNTDLIRCYYEVTEGETISTGIRPLLHHAFTEIYPELSHLKEERLMNQTRAVINNKRLPVELIDLLKTEALKSLENVEDNINYLEVCSGIGSGEDTGAVMNYNEDTGVVSRTTTQPATRNTRRLTDENTYTQTDTLVSASPSQRTRTTTRETSRRRMKWTDEMNQFILRTYLEVTNIETDKTAYRQKVHEAFLVKYPHLTHITQQRLADQCRVIHKNSLIPKPLQIQIRQEVQTQLANNYTTTQQDENIRIETEPRGEHMPEITPIELVQPTTNIVQMHEEFHTALTLYTGLDPTAKPPIPRQKYTYNLKHIVHILNTNILPAYIQADTTLEDVHNIIYCGAMAAAICNGSKITPTYNTENNKPHARKPAWEKRIASQIANVRRDLGRLTQYVMGNRSAKLRRHVNKILTSRSLHSTHDEINKDIHEYIDTLTQKLNLYSKRLKRYKRANDRTQQNTLFKLNEKQFYRKLTQQNPLLSTSTPTPEMLHGYWSQLWSNDVGHNTDASWLSAEITNAQNITPMECTVFTHTDVKNATKLLQNWKSPGADKIHNYWLKHFTCTHALLAKHFTYLINNPNKTPPFFTKGITYMLPKDGDTQNPANYRPITCLSTLYKLLTSCITHKIYEHCTQNNIISDEQKGCSKFSQGCKELLLIDSVVLEQSRHDHRNIHTAFIDYKKAFDSVPHSWLQQVLTLYKIDRTLTNFLTHIMSSWQTTLALKNDTTTITTQTIHIKRGIFQGDSLSPLWFCLALNPLSRILNHTNYGYNIKHNTETQHIISHLFYMDDIKLYSSTAAKLKNLLRLTEIFSDDIRMEFGIDKCKTQHIAAGQRVLEGFNLQNGEFIRPMDEGDTYKYLGMRQSQHIQHTQTKNTLTKQYTQRLHAILKTQLDGRNTIKAINTYAIPILTYSFGVIRWTNTDLEYLQRKTRTILTHHRKHHPRASSIRLCIPRSKGGRGLIDLKSLHDTLIHKLRVYFKSKAQTTPLHKAIILADKAYTPLNMNAIHETPPQNRHEQILFNIQQWKQKALHGRYLHEVSDELIDQEATQAWLTKCNIFPETEAFMLAIQDQVILTRNYRKHIIKDNTLTNDLCRQCGRMSETIQHITSACPTLAPTDYKHRHDQVAKIIHQKLAILHKLSTDLTPYYKYTPPTILENNTHRLYWDRTILTDKTIHHNRPDITLFDLNEKIVYLIEIAVPNTHNLQNTYTHKRTKYVDLAEELRALGGYKQVITIPVVLSSTGIIPRNIHDSLRALKLQKNTYIHLQKAVIINTCHITRKFLNISYSTTPITHQSQNTNTTEVSHTTYGQNANTEHSNNEVQVEEQI